MATRIRGSEPINAVSNTGSTLSGATTGPKMTYTCPANKQAVVRFVSCDLTNLAPTVSILCTINAVVIRSFTAAASFIQNTFIVLNPGDMVQLNVDTVVAASTFDGLISAEEYPVS